MDDPAEDLPFVSYRELGGQFFTHVVTEKRSAPVDWSKSRVTYAGAARE